MGDAASFADLLKRHRAAAGLTQEQLAERANLSARTVSDLERGIIRRPYPGTVQRVVQALDLTEIEAAGFERAVKDGPAAGNKGGAPGEAGFQTLPLQPTPFIGRRQDVEEVKALLERDGVRLLTLTGPGGVGKTRLALRVAEDLGPHFSQGVVFVSLAPLTDPGLVASTVAGALGVQERGGQPVLESLIEHLRPNRLLLLLDNFEHLLPAPEVIPRLLASCPQLTILVTSRSVLHLAAEHEYAVPPLPTPTPLHLPALQALSRYDSVQLFLQRCRAIKPGFEMTEDNAASIAEICCRLDGLPLAIELAAAYIRLFSPQTLLARLSDRLQFLIGGPSDAPARQQTLRRTIDWSYELLSDEARVLLARLSVFAGGCTLEAAEAVCNPDGTLDLLGAMTALVRHSLVRAEGRDDIRFSMLATIGAYAGERLRDRGETQAVKRLHATYFSEFAEQAEHALHGAEQRRWLQRLDDELQNLRVSLTWLSEQSDVDRVVVTAFKLTLYWRRRGNLTEGQSWLEAALSSGHTMSPSLRAQGLLALGRLASFRNDYQFAATALTDSADIFHRLGDKGGEAWALAELGNLAENMQESDVAMRRLEQGLKLFSEVGDNHGQMVTLRWLGTGAIEAGDIEYGERLLMESETLATSLNDAQALAMALFSRSIPRMEQGRYGEAEELLREAVRLAVDLGDTLYVLDCLELLACAIGCEGVTDIAATVLAAVTTMREEMGIPLPPALQVRCERWNAIARAQSDERMWRAAWERGVTLPLEEAVAATAVEKGDRMDRKYPLDPTRHGATEPEDQLVLHGQEAEERSPDHVPGASERARRAQGGAAPRGTPTPQAGR